MEDLGAGIVGKLKKRWRYGSLARYIVEDGFDFVYMRSDHNANPFTIRMARRVRRPASRGRWKFRLTLQTEYRTLGLKEKTELANRPYLPAARWPAITRRGDIQ